MGIPQFIVLFLYALSLGIAMAQHGQPRKGKHDFFSSLITLCIMLTLLIWGGFFN